MQATPAVDAMELPAAKRIAGGFYLILMGEFVSMLGSQLTAFALGVWLFQRTGSVLNFSELTVFATLPALLLLPVSGTLADRWDRRAILIGAECIALVCAGIMGTLLWLGRFTLGELFVLQSVLSLSMALQAPAATAVITSIVPKSQFGRALGLFRIAYALCQFGAPLIAAPLLGAIGMAGIVAIDMLTFGAAILGIALARFPEHVSDPQAPSRRLDARGLFSSVAWTGSFLRAYPAIAAIYTLSCLGSFVTGMVVVLIAPMVLSDHSAQVLSWVSTCGAVGILASGVMMAGWGGVKRWSWIVPALSVLQGLMVALAGLTRSIALLCLCAFVVMSCGSMVTGCTSAILRRKVPQDRQGSFAAFQQAVALAVIPLSAVVGGLLAQFVFEPALAPGGAWAHAVGTWLGVGKGRGTGFLFVVMGLIAAVLSVCVSRYHRLRHFESEVQDAF